MNLLPIATRVFAKTLSLELVEVKPLPSPKGVLFYNNYQYEQDKRTIRKAKINSIFN